MYAKHSEYPVSADLSNEKNYTELTVCVRTYMISFQPSMWEANYLFSLQNDQDDTFKDFRVDFGLYEPLSAMRDFGKHVCFFIVLFYFNKLFLSLDF